MKIYPKVLIISNKFDFSTDLIAHQLKADYVRINRDQFQEYLIEFDPLVPILNILIENVEYVINQEHLLSVFFRAPTFLRDIFQGEVDAEQQLYRTQWAAFIRALIVFEDALWVNNPVDTYKAEIKALQLSYAKQVGLLVPHSVITNKTTNRPGEIFAIKSIDTAIVSTKEEEAFVYTSIVEGSDLQENHYSSPFFLQEALTPKIDVRITIIGQQLIAMYIKGNVGIRGDWRKFEDELIYEPFELPSAVKVKILDFTRKFKLNYAAIDMVLYNSEYHFIEVNPTGEWAWLQKNTGIDMGLMIAKYLCHENLGE
jgi:hypothetical protein